MEGKMSVRRFSRLARSTWATLGVAFLVLVVLESVGRVGFAVSERRKEAAVNRIMVSRLYNGQQWAHDLFREEYNTRLRWHSYVYWRRAPYRGQYVNVDALGHRRTWNKTPSPVPGQQRVFMFGGSALWGTGARDEFTIPSLLSKKMNESAGQGVWVTNFGETGYVSTQEVIALMLELEKGHIPNVVVFYNGYNDILATVQSGSAGVPQNEAHRVAEFNLSVHLNVRGFVQDLALFKFARWVGGSRPFLDREDPRLAEAVVDTYLGNVRIVEALAREYGFTPLFFWQPSVYDKKAPTVWEKRVARGGGAFAAQVRKALDQRMRAAPVRHFYALSRIFDREEETVFIDPVHVSEKGNEKIAEAMVQVIRDSSR